jgi:probable phosphoglycerate mutase
MKEFYFIRHGQTDHNASSKIKEDHDREVSLNAIGKEQAKAVQPLVDQLPIQAVCSSPLRRAQDTKEIVTEKLKAIPHYTIPELGECTAMIWYELSLLKTSAQPGINAGSFIDQVQKGLDQVLSLPSPTLLIVSHGGVHLALCYLLSIEGHDWISDK